MPSSAPEPTQEPSSPTLTPVLIIGSGSAGLAAGAWLSRHLVPFVILERRSGPMTRGQADGVQCRTVEVFESLGLERELLAESYHVIEVAFWAAEDEGEKLEKERGKVRTLRLRRMRTAVDTEPGLSHHPHVILNQARMNDLLIGAIAKGKGGRTGGTGEIRYGVEVKGVVVDEVGASDPENYCVEVVTEEHGVERRYKARYVLGCDGAHSATRKSLGIPMLGDSTDAVWGVMDIYPLTDFPDIRRKCTLRTPAGSLLIIPREGGSLVRFYIELPPNTNAAEVRLPDLLAQARRIFGQYGLEAAATDWWSAYAIGQRRAARFHDGSHRVFLTGDACHTHSPKAGQGMNVSLQDGYNIGWKLGAVLRGWIPPRLLETYVRERERVAADLIDFDRRFARIFSSVGREGGGVTAERFSDEFVKAGRYTAGLTAKYEDSTITDGAGSCGELARGLVVGMRLPSRQAVRFCDARAMQLMKVLPADGRWRLLIFAGSISEELETHRLRKFAEVFETSIRSALAYPDEEVDGFIELIVVFSGSRSDIEFEKIPDLYWPATGQYKVRDLHKIFVDEESYHQGHGKVYEGYAIDLSRGPVAIIVRPDQYVSKICPLEDHEAIIGFFNGLCSA